MFLTIALLIFVASILLIIFTEQSITFLIFQQRQLLHFFGFNEQEGNNPGLAQKMWAKLLDSQDEKDDRFRHRKLWIRIWASVLILFDIFALLFYWLAVQYSN